MLGSLEDSVLQTNDETPLVCRVCPLIFGRHNNAESSCNLQLGILVASTIWLAVYHNEKLLTFSCQ